MSRLKATQRSPARRSQLRRPGFSGGLFGLVTLWWVLRGAEARPTHGVRQ